MNKITLRDKNRSFEAIFIEAANPTHVILFAAGRGGSPERHLPLLSSLAESNGTVIAPYFEMLASPMPTEEELLHRVESMRAALESVTGLNLPVVGIGHSIGATLLLALAGGQMWMRAGHPLAIAPTDKIKKLILFAPPTGFFQSPKALEAVEVPIQAWGGASDTITPPHQLDILKNGLRDQVLLDLRIVDGAGHFSFMNSLPPHIVDSMEKRSEFLESLAIDVARFATRTL